MVDVSQHKLTPEHTKLNDEIVEDALQEHNAERTDLPETKLKDPALPEDAESGDVIRIARNSRTIDKIVIYRPVIE